MEECIEHYFQILNSVAPITNSPFSPIQLVQSTIFPDHNSPHPPWSTTTPLSEPFHETTVLASGLRDTISRDKIQLQLTRMSTTSSCGSDGITVVILRQPHDPTFPDHLYQLYYACLCCGKTPNRWNQAIIYPLCKDSKKPYTATNSRPISLLGLFRKLFECLILAIVSSSGTLTYSGIQAGFRSGYSTLTNVLTLHHLIEADAARHIAFLDFASAFDKVGWIYLEKELKQQGMNPLVLHLIHQLMYQNMSFSLIVNGCPSL